MAVTNREGVPTGNMPCTEACRARLECAVCGRIKAPRGRSVPLAMANGMCTDDCPGFRADPSPTAHLWPNEELESPATAGQP
jgi:hypothetical protein